MKLLIPIEIEVEPVTAGEPLTDAAVQSARTGIENALKNAQANGFPHEKEAYLSILLEKVGPALEISEEGPYTVQHEFDNEPTHVCPKDPTIESPEDSRTITLGQSLPHTLRLKLADLLRKVLNSTPK